MFLSWSNWTRIKKPVYLHLPSLKAMIKVGDYLNSIMSLLKFIWLSVPLGCNASKLQESPATTKEYRYHPVLNIITMDMYNIQVCEIIYQNAFLVQLSFHMMRHFPYLVNLRSIPTGSPWRFYKVIMSSWLHLIVRFQTDVLYASSKITRGPKHFKGATKWNLP